MKKFSLKFDWKQTAAAYGGVALCVVAFALNVRRFILSGVNDVYDGLQYGVITLVTLLAPVLLLTLLYASRYILTDEELITVFGLVRSKFSVADMTELVFDKATGKLAIYSGESFMVFRLQKEWANEFIDELKKRNGKLIYNERDDFSKKKADDEKDDKK